jgi:hypothetical protein
VAALTLCTARHAAWKLAAILLLTSGVTGLASAPVWPATGFAAAYLALAVGYAVGMARMLRRQRRDQVGTFGRVPG